MRFLWNDDGIDICDQCLLVVPGALREFADRLFMKDVCEPEVVVIDDLPFVAESSVTVIATVCLDTIFFSSFYRPKSTAIGALFMFF